MSDVPDGMHRTAPPMDELTMMLNKLTKWRRFFAGWQLGSRDKTDPEAAAVADHREVTILLRAELNAITGLMLRKKLITPDELTRAVYEEVKALDAAYERAYPGVSTVGDGPLAGLNMKLPEAAETMKRMNFKP